MNVLHDVTCARALEHPDPGSLPRRPALEVHLDVGPLPPELRLAAACLCLMGCRGIPRLPIHEAHLREVAATRLEVTRHAFEMGAEFSRREVRERVDRTDGAVERPAEVEVRHVANEHLARTAKTRASEVDHLGG